MSNIVHGALNFSVNWINSSGHCVEVPEILFRQFKFQTLQICLLMFLREGLGDGHDPRLIVEAKLHLRPCLPVLFRHGIQRHTVTGQAVEFLNGGLVLTLLDEKLQLI